MIYNHSSEENKFRKEWIEKAKQYRKAGMTDAQIAEIYKFDREVFNSDRRYAENTVILLENEYNPNLKMNDDYLSDSRYGWMDEIEDMEAYKKVMSFPKIWREAFTMYIYDGYNQQEISLKLLKPRRTIAYWIVKIAEIIF